jgi:hypothetical protein
MYYIVDDCSEQYTFDTLEEAETFYNECEFEATLSVMTDSKETILKYK